MKPPLWICVFGISLAAALPGFAATADSQVVHATVFTDRARVVRSATVNVPTGVSEWTLERLPTGLLDDSVQVSGTGTTAVAVLDVTTKVQYVTAAADRRVQELEDAITRVRRKIELSKQRKAALASQRELLNKIENAVAAPPPKEGVLASRPGFEEWQKLLNFSEESREKFAAQELALREDGENLEAEQAALRSQLDEIQGKVQGDRSFKAVTVRLSAEGAGEVNLKLAYTVGGASWTPQYDARLQSTDRKLNVNYFGVVRQATGEDWTNIALTLSTAKPSLGGGAPELDPWFVDVYRPPAANDEVVELSPFTVSKREDRGYAAASSPGGARVRTQLKDIASPATVVQTQATSASFVIEAKTTIPSDNSPQKVSVAAGSFPAALKYQTTPKALEAAFLTATAKNATDYPFLPGNVNLFLDDAFTSTGTIKAVMPGESFDLALGADEGIAVKRKQVNRFAEETGLTGKGRRITYEFSITVTNNKRSTEKVVVRDLLPVSRDERIVVKLVSPPAREVVKEEGGKLAWTLDLKPGEKKELPLKFTLDYPGDIQVSGAE